MKPGHARRNWWMNGSSKAMLFLVIKSQFGYRLCILKEKRAKTELGLICNKVTEHTQYVHNWTMNVLPVLGNRRPICFTTRSFTSRGYRGGHITGHIRNKNNDVKFLKENIL